MCTDLLVTLPILNSGTIISGAVSQFTGPFSGICPGDDVTFTCVVDSGATIWTFSQPGEPGRTCTYFSALPDQNPCNPPNERFRISQTEGSASNSSSLSVASITENLNETIVGCRDGGDGNPVGTDNICIVGTTVPQTLMLASDIFLFRKCLSSTVTYCQHS